MKRLFLILLLGASVASAQTAKTRAALYTEIDTELANNSNITAAKLRAVLKNATASSQNGLTDGAAALAADLTSGLATKQAADADLTIFAGITPAANVQSLLSAADYSAIRTLLGLVIGTNVQAYDADLATYAGITPSANVQSFLAAADYSAARGLLSLVVGTDVQAFDADLTTWAGVTPSANGQSLVSAADYAAMRALLGVSSGSGDVITSGNNTYTAGTSLFGANTTATFNGTLGGTPTGGTLDLSLVTLSLGTVNATTFTPTNISGATANGQLFIGNVTSGNFTKATITAGSGISVTNGAASITIAATGGAGAPSAYQTLTDGATVTWTAASGYAQQNAKVTLAGNRTLAFSGLSDGMSGLLQVIQDGTGSRTLTLPANSYVQGAGAGAVTLTATAGARDFLEWTYDGTNTYWSSPRLNFTTNADVTAPTLSSATIGTNGTTFTMVFSETVDFGAGGSGGFVPTMSTGTPTLGTPTGNGTNTLIYTLSTTVLSGTTGTLAYTQPGNGVEDTALNDLATFAGAAIVNNSTQTGGGPALVASVSTGNDTLNSVTSGAINTTGANLLVVSVAWYSPGTLDGTLTDSKGNTWTSAGLTKQFNSNNSNQLFYLYSPTVGTGHTFTFSLSSSYPSISVLAFSGVAASPFDQQNGANEVNSDTDMQPGSITPSQANSIVVAGMVGLGNSGVMSINDGFTISYVVGTSGVSVGGGIAYKILTTATATNPTWTLPDAQIYKAATIANFKY